MTASGRNRTLEFGRFKQVPVVEASPSEIDAAERLPCERLRPYIARYGGFDIRCAPKGVTRGLPSRHVTLMIGWRDPFCIAGSGSFTCFVGGLRDEPAIVEAGRATAGIHVFLKPLGMRALFGVPSAAVAGDVVHLNELVGSSAEELRDRLRAAESWARRFEIVDQALSRLVSERRVSRELEFAWHKLIGTSGTTRIKDLADGIGWSRRYLTERFRAELGVTPKTTARIARFERACALIKRDRPPLVDVSAVAGYHDQAHMTREWRALAGCTPSTWIAEALPFIQDYELAGME